MATRPLFPTWNFLRYVESKCISGEAFPPCHCPVREGGQETLIKGNSVGSQSGSWCLWVSLLLGNISSGKCFHTEPQLEDLWVNQSNISKELETVFKAALGWGSPHKQGLPLPPLYIAEMVLRRALLLTGCDVGWPHWWGESHAGCIVARHLIAAPVMTKEGLQGKAEWRGRKPRWWMPWTPLPMEAQWWIGKISVLENTINGNE